MTMASVCSISCRSPRGSTRSGGRRRDPFARRDRVHDVEFGRETSEQSALNSRHHDRRHRSERRCLGDRRYRCAVGNDAFTAKAGLRRSTRRRSRSYRQKLVAATTQSDGRAPHLRGPRRRQHARLRRRRASCSRCPFGGCVSSRQDGPLAAGATSSARSRTRLRQGDAAPRRLRRATVARSRAAHRRDGDSVQRPRISIDVGREPLQMGDVGICR